MTRGRAALLLLLVSGAASAASYAWMDGNGFFARPMPCDAAGYRLDALTMAEAWRDGGPVAWLKAGFAHDKSHPPLVVMTAGAVAALRDAEGVDQVSAWIAIQLFGLAFLLGAYRLARNFGGRGMAVGAAAITACMPFFITQTRPLYPQFPMAAATTWTLDVCLRSARFTRPGVSALAGLAAGAALLCKMLAPLYAFGAALTLWIAGLADPARRARSIRGGAAAVAAALVVAGPWYALHGGNVGAYAASVVGAEGQRAYSRGHDLFALERWIYFPRALFDDGLGVAWSFVLLAALAALALRSLRRKREAPSEAKSAGGGEILALVMTVVVSYAVLSSGQIAGEAFYLVPWAPLAATVIAAAAAEAGGRRKGVVAALAVVGVAMHALCLRPFDRDAPWPERGAFPIADRAEGWFVPIGRYDALLSVWARSIGSRAAPDAEAWPNAEFAAAIARHAPRSAPRVVQTSWHPFMDQQTMEYEARLRGVSFVPVSGDWLLKGPPEEASTRLRTVDFAVLHERPALPGEFLPGPAEARLAASEIDREVRVLGTAAPTPFQTLTLVQFATPGAVHGFVDEASADSADVRRTDRAVEGGPRVRAFARRATPKGLPLVVVWFDAASIVAETSATIALPSGATASAGLRPRPKGEGMTPLFAATFEGFSGGSGPPDAAAEGRVLLRTTSGDEISLDE